MHRVQLWGQVMHDVGVEVVQKERGMTTGGRTGWQQTFRSSMARFISCGAFLLDTPPSSAPICTPDNSASIKWSGSSADSRREILQPLTRF